MLIRSYKDRNGESYELNLEQICGVSLFNTDVPFEDLNDDYEITVWIGSLAFPTTKKVYLEMVAEVHKNDMANCNSKPLLYISDTEGCGCCEAATPSISMYHAKRKIMSADYISADTKMRLLVDLDILL